jgi:hypothetical protein
MSSKSNFTTPAVTRATGQDAAASNNALLAAIIRRIEETVDAETTGIRTNPKFDIKASNARKSRYLYELMKAMKTIGEAAIAAAHRENLIRLRGKLAANETAILAHLGAVTEVAIQLRDAIRHSEADGTYSDGAFGSAG